MKKLPELALVDAQIAAARSKTQERLQWLLQRRRARKMKRPLGGSKSTLERRLEAINKGVRRDLERADAADRNAEELRQSGDCMAPGGRFDAWATSLKAEAMAKRRPQREARARYLIAEKLAAVGLCLECPELVKIADKLELARRVGCYGVHLPTGRTVLRMRDRSGRIREDPSDSRERTAQLIERLEPRCLHLRKRGLRFYKAVISEPNFPAGGLKFGKEHLFKRVATTLLDINKKGQRVRKHLRNFPEIVGVFAVQEDPLSADITRWNIHLNVIIVIDPSQCTPLPPEECPLDPETGLRKRDPAADFPGMFSFMKLRHVWGSDQIEIRPLEGTRAQFIAALKECIKYACKTVNEKSLEKFEHETGESLQPLDELSPLPELELEAPPSADFVGPPKPRCAPPLIAWPDPRVLEWYLANKGFRRVRQFGVLYRLPKIVRQENIDADIRWLGRIWITPWKITVQLDIFEGSSLVDWIQENKSPLDRPLAKAQSPPHAGSMPAV